MHLIYFKRFEFVTKETFYAGFSRLSFNLGQKEHKNSTKWSFSVPNTLHSPKVPFEKWHLGELREFN